MVHNSVINPDMSMDTAYETRDLVNPKIKQKICRFLSFESIDNGKNIGNYRTLKCEMIYNLKGYTILTENEKI